MATELTVHRQDQLQGLRVTRWPGVVGLVVGGAFVAFGWQAPVGALAFVVAGLVVVGVSLLWMIGLLGRSDMVSLARGRAEVRERVHGAAGAFLSSEALSLAAALLNEPEDDDRALGTGPSHGHGGGTPPAPPESSQWQSAVADGVVYGAAAAAADFGGTADSVITVHEWLAPDSAAVAAFEHVKGQEFANIFDLRSALEGSGYKLADPGSVANWTGHTFEHTVNEQVLAWAGTDALEIPPSASFAGPDAEMFGTEIQYKAYADFSDIADPYGSTLIVPEGTVNLPPDAVNLDFSEQFDGAVLSENHVFVAEGVTHEATADSWDTVAGPALVGDLGDVLGDAAGEVAGDIALLGLGTAIRAAGSAHRRRDALSDPNLRARASEKVAKDAALGAGGAAVGGTIGTFLIPIPFLGTALGAGIGGMLGGGVARGIDRSGIQAMHVAVGQALEALGVRVTETERWSVDEWRRRSEQAVERADRLSAAYSAAVNLVTSDLNEAVQRAATICPAERNSLVESATETVTSSQGRQITPLTARRMREWMARRAELDECNDPIEILTLVYCCPGGEQQVDAWVDQRMEQRAASFVAADLAMSSLRASARDQRHAARNHLQGEKSRIRTASAERIRPAAERLKTCQKDYQNELKVNGL